jgi:hypothetical protein
VMVDDLDDTFATYLIEYSFGNSVYAIYIPARSWEEAQERIKRIGAFGRVIGSDVTVYPASLGWWTKLLVWCRNLSRTEGK